MGIDGAAHVPSKLSLVAKLQAGVCARAASNSEVPPRCHRRAPWIRLFPTTPPSMHTTHRQPVLLMKEKHATITHPCQKLFQSKVVANFGGWLNREVSKGSQRTTLSCALRLGAGLMYTIWGYLFDHLRLRGRRLGPSAGLTSEAT